MSAGLAGTSPDVTTVEFNAGPWCRAYARALGPAGHRRSRALSWTMTRGGPRRTLAQNCAPGPPSPRPTPGPAPHGAARVAQTSRRAGPGSRRRSASSPSIRRMSAGVSLAAVLAVRRADTSLPSRADRRGASRSLRQAPCRLEATTISSSASWSLAGNKPSARTASSAARSERPNVRHVSNLWRTCTVRS
jgi:hypothetical protein